jgi:hypothetical protein
MSEGYYVLRMGRRRGLGAYVVYGDGDDDWVTSTRQSRAYRWEPSDKAFAELAMVDVGDARLVRVTPRATSTGKGK